MSIESVMPSNHLTLCRPLLLPPSIFPSTRVFCIRWPKYWSFSFSISPPNKYSGLISFRIDWFYLLAVQGSAPTPQFKSINSSALSFLYGPTPTLYMTNEKIKACFKGTHKNAIIFLSFNYVLIYYNKVLG